MRDLLRLTTILEFLLDKKVSTVSNYRPYLTKETTLNHSRLELYLSVVLIYDAFGNNFKEGLC